jgi:hypothetical protein
MSQRAPGLKVLEARKQLLLVESKLNREEFSRELDHLRDEYDRMKRKARVAGSIASAATLLTTTASAIHRHYHPSQKSGSIPTKKSWVSAALSHANAGTSLYLKVRSLLRNRH